MTLEKKLEKWNKKKAKHRYLITAKVDIEWGGPGCHTYRPIQKIYDAYNEKHALMQFYMYCVENHYSIPGDETWDFVDDRLVIKELA